MGKRKPSHKSSCFHWCLCRFAACNPKFCHRIRCFNQRLCNADRALKKLTGRC